MENFGKVQELSREFTFEWSIDDFFSILKKGDKTYESPSFSFAGESWCLIMYPNGVSYSLAGYIGLFLRIKSPGSPVSLGCSLNLKTVAGKEDFQKQYAHMFKEEEDWGYPNFVERSILTERKSELVPSDILTIVCTLEHYSKSTDDTDNTDKADCSYCKQAWNANYLSSHEQKCLYKPITCSKCNSVVTLRKQFDHDCQMSEVKETETLVKDMGSIMQSEEHSDVTIQVKDREFRLHRIILAGRNPYFSSMFKTEMKEKTTGVVTIHDCEPDIFETFTKFIYTGQISLSYDNVCALYEVADKYQENILNAECVRFMKNRVSVDSFCDFTALALKFGEKELLESITKFFCLKVKEVIRTVKWQTFLKEYSTEANELYIKAADYYTT